MVASCSSCFDLKWANSPLLLIPTALASRPIERLIDTAVERFATVPSPMTSILFEHFHGAVTRIAPTANRCPPPRTRLEPLHPLRMDRPGRHRRQHQLDTRNIRRPAARANDPSLAQLPRRRPSRRRHPRRLRPQLPATPRHQAPLRPRQRLPPQPQHRSLTRPPKQPAQRSQDPDPRSNLGESGSDFPRAISLAKPRPTRIGPARRSEPDGSAPLAALRPERRQISPSARNPRGELSR